MKDNPIVNFVLVAGVAASAQAAPIAATQKVLFLGDSLTAGAGLPIDTTYPKLLKEALRQQGITTDVRIAGMNGSTTASGPARLKALLPERPDVLVLALGANDGLRGVPVATMKQNLLETVRLAKTNGMKVLLVGMKAWPAYGTEYFNAFQAAYLDIAKTENVPLVPFLLEGVALDPNFNLPDGFHPNALGQARMARTVLPYLRAILT